MGGILVATAAERRRWIGWVTGTAISAALAMFLIYSARGTPRSLLVPIVFIVFIILCARYFGLLAGIAGSVLATGLFALFLYEPYGRLAVKDHQAELNLVL